MVDTVCLQGMDLNSIREKITRIWVGVLGGDVFDVNESFYNIGGSSIIAMKINMLILKEFNIEYTMDMYEKYTSVSAQSHYIYERLKSFA